MCPVGMTITIKEMIWEDIKENFWEWCKLPFWMMFH